MFQYSDAEKAEIIIYLTQRVYKEIDLSVITLDISRCLFKVKI